MDISARIPAVGLVPRLFGFLSPKTVIDQEQSVKAIVAVKRVVLLVDFGSVTRAFEKSFHTAISFETLKRAAREEGDLRRSCIFLPQEVVERWPGVIRAFELQGFDIYIVSGLDERKGLTRVDEAMLSQARFLLEEGAADAVVLATERDREIDLGVWMIKKDYPTSVRLLKPTELGLSCALKSGEDEIRYPAALSIGKVRSAIVLMQRGRNIPEHTRGMRRFIEIAYEAGCSLGDGEVPLQVAHDKFVDVFTRHCESNEDGVAEIMFEALRKEHVLKDIAHRGEKFVKFDDGLFQTSQSVAS